MSEPLVSICIPNFNNGKYLDFCLQSALNQTYKNIEIIFVDDCSTDDSIKIANKYREKILILQNSSNVGQPRNTNKCVAHSRGKYLVILHSDDALLPDFAEKLVPLLEAYTTVGMAVGERLETDETGILKEIAPFYNIDCIIIGEKQAKVFMMTSFLPCQVLMRRDIFDKIGGVDERHIVNLDGLLWFKFSLVADVGYIRDKVSIYRKHKKNTTNQYNQTIGHMMEYYCTLSSMFKLALNKTYLIQFFDEAVKRIGFLTLRYSHNLFQSGNYEMAKRYVALAPVFDPDIVKTHIYQTLKYCAESPVPDPFILYQKLIDTMPPEIRTFSYDPPEGSMPYHRCNLHENFSGLGRVEKG